MVVVNFLLVSETEELQCLDCTSGVGVQVELVGLLSQCMADGARWEDGLRQCEKAMSVLPSATHLPLSKWKVTSAFQMYIVLHHFINHVGVLANMTNHVCVLANMTAVGLAAKCDCFSAMCR